MKVKIGDLTVNQIIKVCNDNYNVNHTGCIGCPLFPESGGCMMCHEPDIIEYHHFNEKEIDMPDKEEENA